MKFALVGYGRMGREIERLAIDRGHVGVATLDDGSTISPEALAAADVAFEFTEPDAAAANVAALIDAGVAVVCGTTGWTPDAALLDRARMAERPVVIAPNFSIGMNLFYRLVRDAARVIGSMSVYDPFLWEAHHRGKRDAPSGTARRLAEIVRDADGGIDAVQEGSADGGVPAGTLQVTSVRAGAIPGTHRVGWDGPYDTITLEHTARSRAVFALGAVMAAEWQESSRGLQQLDDLIATRIMQATPASETGEEPT